MPVTGYAHTPIRLSCLWLFFWASSLLAAASCAGLPPVPGNGGPRWLQVESEHCVLLTDAAQPRALEASATIERRRSALCQLAFDCQDRPSQKLRVIALHGGGQFEQLYGTNAPSAESPELVYAPVLVLPNGLTHGAMVPLTRMLTTLVALQTLGPLPAWLRSGLTSYYETAHDDAGGTFVVGDRVQRHLDFLRRHPRLRAAELLNLPPSAVRSPAFAASAWLLVHYLMSQRSADLTAFEEGIASGRGLAAAFHEAFPDLSPELLDGLLDRYAGSDSFLTQSKQITGPPPRAWVAPLSDADVYSLRAEVGATCGDCGAAQRKRTDEQIALALAREPHHVRATILRAQRAKLTPNARSARAQSLVTAHPESWLSWVHLAYTQPERACTTRVQDRLRALAPGNAHVISLQARCELQAGRRQSALVLSKRAFAAYPISPRITLAYARVLHDAGACHELDRLLGSALELRQPQDRPLNRPSPGQATQSALPAADTCVQAHASPSPRPVTTRAP